jgi:hypothetical protein
MPDKESDSLDRSHLRQMALSRWDNEGGAGPGGRVHLASTMREVPFDVPPLTNAELVQLQVRVIALENLVMALLAEASDRQCELARELAAFISPRPGFTPHRLTIHAAAQMINLVEGAAHFRVTPLSSQAVGVSPDGHAPEERRKRS